MGTKFDFYYCQKCQEKVNMNDAYEVDITYKGKQSFWGAFCPVCIELVKGVLNHGN